MEQTQIMTVRKSVRKDSSRTGWAMILYAIVSTIVSMVWMTGETIIRSGFRLQGVTDEAQQEKIFEDVLIEVTEMTGTYLIVGVLAGLLCLLPFLFGSDRMKSIFRTEKKMTLPCFLALTCVFFGGQLVFSGAYELMEAGLNLIGFTAESSMEMATAGSQTVSMFIYAGIVAPIAEELVYRGLAMRCLEKHGKALAIVVSSLLFAVMHANLPQSVFAFMVGLVLGYVAMEYSIIWSILLHILNNMVLGDLMSKALEGCSEQVQNIVNLSVLGLFFLLGLIVLIRNGRKLFAWIRENMWEKPRMRWTLTTVSMLLFVGAHLVMAIALLERCQ
ncbi:MAG: CPBP family intramembrane metalloprotease [Oscillospiraceae bacterium]|nr:CPBP family intramembrane metalloprotease [Oscillospiraceae bacterium]